MSAFMCEKAESTMKFGIQSCNCGHIVELGEIEMEITSETDESEEESVYNDVIEDILVELEHQFAVGLQELEDDVFFPAPPTDMKNEIPKNVPLRDATAEWSTVNLGPNTATTWGLESGKIPNSVSAMTGDEENHLQDSSSSYFGRQKDNLGCGTPNRVRNPEQDEDPGFFAYVAQVVRALWGCWFTAGRRA